MYPTNEPHVSVLTELGRRGHGAVTREDLLRRSIPASTIRNWLRSGRLVQIHPGVYQIGGVPDLWRSRALADVRYLDRQARRITQEHAVRHVAALSGVAGAWLHGFPWVEQPESAFVVSNRSSRCRGVLHAHRPELRACHVIDLDGLPTTTPAITFVESCAVFSRDRIENHLVELPRQGIVTLNAILAAMQLFPSSAGIPDLLMTLERFNPMLFATRSGPERMVIRGLIERGVDGVSVNKRVQYPEGTIEHDIWFSDIDHAEEIDGPHHLLPTQRRRDAERDLIIARSGGSVHRTSTAAIDEDAERVLDEMVERIKDLRSRSKPGP